MGWEVGPCDPAGFEKEVRSFLATLKRTPSEKKCTFVPQTQFIWGVNNRSKASRQYCDHILHIEHLDDEFKAFMESMGQTLTMSKKRTMSREAYSGCTVDPSTITRAVKDLVHDYYRGDYEALG